MIYPALLFARMRASANQTHATAARFDRSWCAMRRRALVPGMSSLHNPALGQHDEATGDFFLPQGLLRIAPSADAAVATLRLSIVEPLLNKPANAMLRRRLEAE